MSLTATQAAWAADALLLLHAGIVVFVVVMLPAVLWGGPRGWRWVRRPVLRWLHLLLIGVVALQAWLGQLCPLTLWENALRLQAGQSTYGGSFITHWVSAALYWDLPGWVFTLAYTGFLAAVAAAWWRWPPRPSSTGRSPSGP
jgi:polyferredoxin